MVLPKSLRTAHRWQPGTEFTVEDRVDGIVLRPKRQDSTMTWDDMIGCVNYKGPRKTLRQMDEGVIVEARRHK